MEEKEFVLDLESSEKPKSLILSIINSKELSEILREKLSKYVDGGKKTITGAGKNKGISGKLEEGYESSDSGDSVTSNMTTSTYSEVSSSGFSDISSYNSDIQSITKENNNMEGDPFFKIYKGIFELQTHIPNKTINKNNTINETPQGTQDKKEETVVVYPLEFYEIFPNLKKFELTNLSSSHDLIEKPIPFIKNLILKIYHESLSYMQNKFHLQNFKKSPNYQYKIMNISHPINYPSKSNNDDFSESISCMIHGYYQNNSTDKKNKNIENVNSIILKLTQTQSIFVNFIFFGYKSGKIEQYVLVDIKTDFKALPADNFFFYREYSTDSIFKDIKVEKHVLSMSLSNNENFLLAGYASGHIIIWRTTNGKVFHVFNDIFDMPVVSCEFISVSSNEKDYLILVGDLVGKVRLIQFTKTTFKDKCNIIIVSNCFYPCLLMKKLKINKREGETEFNIGEIMKKVNDKSYICVIGNLESVELFMIIKGSLKIKSILFIKNPDLNILMHMSEEIKKNSVEFYSQKNLKEKLGKIEFPDAAFGLGYLGDLVPIDDNNKEPFILFAISWKYKIILYYLTKDLSDMQEVGWYINNSPIIKIGFIGVSLMYFIDKNNNIKIINVKLFNRKPEIYDKDNDNDGDFKISFDRNNDYKTVKNKFIIPLSDIITIDHPIKSIAKYFTDSINYYSPFIINCKYNIYLIQEHNFNDKIIDQKNNITHVHLLSYQEFFNETTKAENWDLFFCKFIDIFKTYTNTFGFIPEDKEMKENLLIEKKPLKIIKDNFFLYYLEKNFEDKLDDADGSFDFQKNYDFLSVGIEFAIDIGSLDFIYNEIKKLKQQKKFKEILVFQLEPFILNNKFLAKPDLISGELITEIINYYTSNEAFKDEDSLSILEESSDKLFKLDLILCHLNIDIVKKIQNIEDIIKKNKLYCSVIYYYSNGLNDFLKPLQYLLDEFTNAKYTQLPKENSLGYFKKTKQSRGYYRDNYNELIKGLKTGNFDLEKNIFIVKEFIGHLLLSFIQLTLKGLLFPNIGKIPQKLYDTIIPELFLFLTKKDVAEKLISFDSFSYFETLTLFFLREDEINKIIMQDSSDFVINFENKKNKKRLCPLNIEQIDLEKLKCNIEEYNDDKIDKNNKINKTSINNDNNKIKEDNLKINEDYFWELIYKIMELCENKKLNISNLIIKFDLYLFMVKISLKIKGISLKTMDKALLTIFNFHNDIKNIKKTMDSQSFAQFFDAIDKFRSHFTIIKRKQSNLDELSSIINMAIKKLYLNNTNSKNEVINNLLKMCSTSHFLGVKIFLYELKKEYIFCIRVFLNENRKISRRVFTFINKTLNLFKNNKEEKNFQSFKNEIKKIISNLAGVSASETFKIIQLWFDSKDVIGSLNNLPKLQFKYLDKLRKIYKRKLKNAKSLESGIDSIKKEYSEILLIYIKLLFFFEREPTVLNILKKEIEYINVKECLKISLTNSIDASVFLYKYSGDEKRALELCLDRIEKDYDEIKSNKDNSKVEFITNKFDEIKKLIDQSIEICQNYSESTEVYKRRKYSIILKNNDNNNNKIINEYVRDKEEVYDMGEDYWLDLFNRIYNIFNDTNNRSQTLIINKINKYLTEKIENLLITMSYYVDFGFILKNVSNELEFSLFKKFLNKIFYTKSHLSNLYNSYINLLSGIINKKMTIVEMFEQEGHNIQLTIKEKNENNLEKEKLILDRINKYNFDYNYIRLKELNEKNEKAEREKDKDKNKKNIIFKKCSLCSKNINYINDEYENENSDIIIFKCEHYFHVNCLLNEYNIIQKNFKNIKFTEYYCPNCVNVENELFSFLNENEVKERNDINIIEVKENGNVKEDVSQMDIKKKKIEEKMKNKNLKKLNLIDNNYFEQIDILQSTLNGL